MKNLVLLTALALALALGATATLTVTPPNDVADPCGSSNC
jgi:hypothetical protein